VVVSAQAMERKSNKHWIAIISIAVLLHLALFYSVKPGFFRAFKKTIDTGENEGQGQPLPAHFIITIPVEIDDSPNPDMEQNPVQEPVKPVFVDQQTTKNSSTPLDKKGYSDDPAADLESLIGESPQALPDNIGLESVLIPPRPVEITWPDTRRLKHCLGHHVDVEIEVSSDGRILQVKAHRSSQPPDCVEAALQSARFIVFEPGLKDGAPATMWTQIRIEFRRKK